MQRWLEETPKEEAWSGLTPLDGSAPATVCQGWSAGPCFFERTGLKPNIDGYDSEDKPMEEGDISKEEEKEADEV